MGLYVSTKHVVQGGLKACGPSRVLVVSLAARASSIFNGNEIEAAQRQDSDAQRECVGSCPGGRCTRGEVHLAEAAKGAPRACDGLLWVSVHGGCVRQDARPSVRQQSAISRQMFRDDGRRPAPPSQPSGRPAGGAAGRGERSQRWMLHRRARNGRWPALLRLALLHHCMAILGRNTRTVWRI